jgi:hypothetical protein
VQNPVKISTTINYTYFQHDIQNQKTDALKTAEQALEEFSAYTILGEGEIFR